MILFVLPDWVTGFNLLMTLFGFLLLTAGAVVVLLVKRKDTVSGLQVDRAVAAEALVKTRESTISDLEKRVEDLEEELEGVTAEHRALAAIDLSKLMEFWAEKESIEAEMRDLKREIRILERRKDGDLVK